MNKTVWILSAALAATVFTPLSAEVLFDSKMNRESDLAGFSKHPDITIRENALTGEFKTRTAYTTLNRKLDPAEYAGRFLRVSCEARAENLLPKKKAFEGIKFMFSIKTPKRQAWEGIQFPTGDYDWKKFEAFVPIPADAVSVTLSLGLQNSAGKFQIRNVKIESIGTPVPIRDVANMGLRDKVAGDNRGGWTDQGPKQDGWCFFGDLFRKNFHGIPIDAEPQGKGILTMHSTYFKGGPEQVVIPLKGVRRKAKTMYLMHTMAWGPQLKDKNVGFITLKDKNGKTQEIPVVYNRDVADWYRHIATLTNGYGALRGTTGDGNIAGVYLSRFEVDPEMDAIAEVKFRSVPDGLWVILGATLCGEDIPLPKSVTTKIQAGTEWLPLVRPARNRIEAGSALDLSPFMRKGTVDELGRVVIRNGHFVFEKDPARKVRFLTNALTPHSDLRKLSHKDIEQLVIEMRRNGYNMVRTHFLDQSLLMGSRRDLEFNPQMLDSLDYLLFCMKKHGVYWNFDCMTSWIGYQAGNMWKSRDHKKSLKSLIYHDKAARENWIRGVEKFLCRVNPYTKTRMIDDPVLVMAVAFNEQEFGFWREFDETWFLPKWRSFLRKKYGTVEALRRSWGKDSARFKSFDEIPCFNGTNNYSDADVSEFLLPIEQEMLSWFESQMKRIGFKGYLVNYNAGKNQFFNYLRKDSPLVAMNHYHAHPSNWISKHSFISQKSAIESGIQVFRNFMGTRLTGKPFVVTEQNFAFWNRYRYEQGFVIGGYAAFQNFDALTCHGSPINFGTVRDIQSFGIWHDPIAKASEYLTYFLFIRGDVTPGGQKIRIRVLKDDALKGGGLSTEQSLPALLTGLTVECTENAAGQTPLLPGEIAYRIGTTNSVVVNNAGYSSATDNPVANIGEILLHMRKAGILPPGNKTDGRNLFENATGELLLDKSRNFMRISTPRLQGVCAMAGTKTVLPDFEIRSMSADGNLALVAIDGMKTIAEAKRLMLVYATNALNTNMEFSSGEMITLLNNGTGPTLLKRGAFTVGIRNANAPKLRLYPLTLGGRRIREIKPVRVENGQAFFSVDTGKDGAAVYFELAVLP